MSEKRFEIKADDVDSSIINITRDGEDFVWFLSDDITDKQVEKVVDLLNEKESTIERLERKLELKTEEVEYLNRMMVKWGMVKDE